MRLFPANSGDAKMLRKGDVDTHCYNSRTHGILDANGKILPEAMEARERGVFLIPHKGKFI
jgi:predicted amidohydrolase